MTKRRCERLFIIVLLTILTILISTELSEAGEDWYQKEREMQREVERQLELEEKLQQQRYEIEREMESRMEQMLRDQERNYHSFSTPSEKFGGNSLYDW